MRFVAEIRALCREGGIFTRIALAGPLLSGVLHLLALGGLAGHDADAVANALAVGVVLYGWLFVLRLTVTRIRAMRVQVSYRAFRSAFGSRLWLLVVLLGVYAAFWIFYATHAGPGTGELRGGEWTWVADGVVIRPMTPAEYQRMSANMLVAFSALWCPVSLLLAILHRGVDGYSVAVRTAERVRRLARAS